MARIRAEAIAAGAEVIGDEIIYPAGFRSSDAIKKSREEVPPCQAFDGGCEN